MPKHDLSIVQYRCFEAVTRWRSKCAEHIGCKEPKGTEGHGQQPCHHPQHFSGSADYGSRGRGSNRGGFQNQAATTQLCNGPGNGRQIAKGRIGDVWLETTDPSRPKVAPTRPICYNSHSHELLRWISSYRIRVITSIDK